MTRICNYKEKSCARCGRIFKPRTGIGKYCPDCQSVIYRGPDGSFIGDALNTYMRRWRRTPVGKARMKEWRSRPNVREKLRAYERSARPIRNERRRQVRRQVQDAWGRLGSIAREQYEATEEYAETWLMAAGFEKVHRFTLEFPHFPFDLAGEKDSHRYLIQVTVRTHAEDVARHIRLARALGFEYGILFVRPDLQRALFKPCVANIELTLKDVTE